MSSEWLHAGFVGADDGHPHRYPVQLARALSGRAESAEMRILEVGSAAGAIGVWLAACDRRFCVVGIDRSADHVALATQHARARSVAATFHVADAADGLAFADASHDGVVVHRLRDSLVTRAERAALTSEIARVTRPGGLVSLVEDLRVEPRERHGSWYAQRYRLHRRLLDLLLGEHPPAQMYGEWLADKEVGLLLSLRGPDGHKIDELRYAGREAELAGLIRATDVTVRGVGIHEPARRVIDDFARHGLVLARRWRVEIPEPTPRDDRATVMKGLLFRRA